MEHAYFKLLHLLAGHASWALTVVFLLLCPLHAFAGPAEDASAIIDRWARAITANDVEAVVRLYTPDALLHGISSPKLYAGTQSIREYFNTASESGKKVTISESHMVILADYGRRFLRI